MKNPTKCHSPNEKGNACRKCLNFCIPATLLLNIGYANALRDESETNLHEYENRQEVLNENITELEESAFQLEQIEQHGSYDMRRDMNAARRLFSEYVVEEKRQLATLHVARANAEAKIANTREIIRNLRRALAATGWKDDGR